MADRSSLVIGAAVVAETALLAAAAGGHILPVPALLCHGLVVALLAVAVHLARGTKAVGITFMALVGTAVTGPFGALGALVLPLLSRVASANSSLLQAWYDRISNSILSDRLTKLSDHVAVGRSADLGAPAPVTFDALFAGNDIHAQQMALGMIAREFHPSYIAALRVALDSPEPVVRVQAAAVAARVRDKIIARLTSSLKTIADAATPPATTLLLVAEIEACAGSGLVSEAEAHRARADAAVAANRAMAQLDANLQAGEPLGLGETARRAYEHHLLADGQFAAFRDLRRRQRLPWGGRLRRRVIQSPPAFQFKQHLHRTHSSPQAAERSP